MVCFTRRPALRVLAGLALAVGLGSVAQAQTGSGSPTLDAIRTRGQVLCGTAGTVPGFSLPDSKGVMRGLDADSCRAVTAAALGDATKTKFVITTTQNRFTALQSGEVDLLSRINHLDAGARGQSGPRIRLGELL